MTYNLFAQTYSNITSYEIKIYDFFDIWFQSKNIINLQPSKWMDIP